MGKLAVDAAIDGGLNYIAANTKRIYVCTTAAITNYTQASATYNLTTGKTVTSTHFTITTGDVSGRKITVAQQSSLNVSTSGDAGHVALCSTSALIIATTCTKQSLTSGNTVTVPAFDYEIADPT